MRPVVARSSSTEDLDSPSSSTRQSTSRSIYYRPSMELVVDLLKSKIDWFASEERWSMFDHNIRQLSREGLLAQGINPNLVKGQLWPCSRKSIINGQKLD